MCINKNQFILVMFQEMVTHRENYNFKKLKILLFYLNLFFVTVFLYY